MYSTLQVSVIEKARQLVGNEPWFRGVCTDSMPSDQDIQRMGSGSAADTLALDTLCWDCLSSE